LTNTTRHNKLMLWGLDRERQLLQGWNELLLLKERFGNCPEWATV